MSERKKVPRVFASYILSNFGSFLEEEHTPEVAAKYDDAAKRELLKGWINGIIKFRGNLIEDLGDLKKGSDFLVLLEILSGNRLSTGYREPRNFIEMANNLEIFLKFLRHVGIETNNITAMELYEGKFDKVLLVLLLIAQHYEETADNDKALEATTRSGLFKSSNAKRGSIKPSKQLQNTLELKLEQATLDQIYQLAAVHQADLAKEDTRKKEEEKKQKKINAMSILLDEETPKGPQFFTVHLPDGSKEVREYDATLPLMELLENICVVKGYFLDNCKPLSMDDKEVDFDFVLGEIKEKEIKLTIVQVEEVAKPEPQKASKRVNRVQNKNTPVVPGTSKTSTEPQPGQQPQRRGLVRQNSYVSVKIYDPNEDQDELESRKRVQARTNAFQARQVKQAKSPLVIAMEREHKAMLEKLNLDGIKMPDQMNEKDFKVTKLQQLDIASLDKTLRDLEAFESIYGSNQEYSPETFFKDLL